MAQGAFTPLSAYAFMVFVPLCMPCVVVAISMRREFGTWKWFGIAFAYQTVPARTVAFVIYQVMCASEEQASQGKEHREKRY